MFATQEAQVMPPIWMKHLECVSPLRPCRVSLCRSLSSPLSFTGARLEDFERLRFDVGSRELVSVGNKL